jgi:SSS family solute:Na+ symporter
MSWMTVTIVGALATGFVGVAYANQFNLAVDDPETIFIIFSQLLFHPLVSGFLMAAILAAIMSTISSQLLVTIGRFGVAGVAAVALLLALDASNTILSLVSNAWAGFGAAFGPLILFCLYKKDLTAKGALAGMISGAVTVLFWIYAPVLDGGKTLSSVMYEIIPGFAVSALTLYSVSLLTDSPSKVVKQTFVQAGEELANQQS